ncbi:MAG: hypothetical protein J0I12_17405 [Candidatus Eremiobacteraeota bacterium]|nr:hypothetical protein [Candidatus Eremiobacteraeota bacterium]
MSKFSAVLVASLLSLSAWSESPSRIQRGPAAPPATPQVQPSVIFQDPMMGAVKMRPVYTPSAKFGTVPTSSIQVAEVQRPGVSVDQTKTVRPGSWR